MGSSWDNLQVATGRQVWAEPEAEALTRNI
jgi:hypothetical protein